MNLENQTVTGTNQIYISDSLEAPLLKAKITNLANTIIPSSNELIVYVDKQPYTNPTSERKQFVFELNEPLKYFNDVSDEFNLEICTKNSDVVLETYIERKIGLEGGNAFLLTSSVFEEIDGSLINLFDGINYIYTNYSNASLEVMYSKDDALNKRYLNSAIYYNHKIKNDGEFGLDDIYFKDAFTKTENKLNLEVNDAKIETLSSKNNSFSLDANGNLVVNTIRANSGLGYNSESICELIYPVGSIYLSVNSTSPSSLFGGTWTRIKDRFLLGAGDIYSAGSTGGESNHVLTTSEMPSHSHTWSQTSCTNPGNHSHDVGADKDGGPGSNRYTVHISNGSTVNNPEYYPSSGGAGSHTHTITGQNSSTGSGNAHNNMPPYITVYMWKRTA